MSGEQTPRHPTPAGQTRYCAEITLEFLFASSKPHDRCNDKKLRIARRVGSCRICRRCALHFPMGSRRLYPDAIPRLRNWPPPILAFSPLGSNRERDGGVHIPVPPIRAPYGSRPLLLLTLPGEAVHDKLRDSRSIDTPHIVGHICYCNMFPLISHSFPSYSRLNPISHTLT